MFILRTVYKHRDRAVKLIRKTEQDSIPKSRLIFGNFI